MSDIAIKVEGIGKQYRIGMRKSGELRETFGNLVRSFRPSAISHQSSANSFWALKDISFEVKQGEAVGIIGRNGAGKSTLLKVLSRITRPTTGRFEINGRVSSLLEVGTGFHPELTGRENIYLNGTILGMRRPEIKAKFDEIISFSGVEAFIDTPVKHYSSGMKVRLAFSVAAHLEPEILIIDEVLAVGDAEFQKKCLGKMEDVTGEGRTVLFVSHNMAAIKQLCQRGMLLTKGSLVFEGKSASVISQYMNSQIVAHGKFLEGERKGNATAVFKGFYIENERRIRTNKVLSGQKIFLCFEVETYIEKSKIDLGFSLHGIGGQNLSLLYTSFTDSLSKPLPKGEHMIRCQIDDFPFTEKRIIVRGRIENNGLESDYPSVPLGSLIIEGNDFYSHTSTQMPEGYPFLLKSKWEVEN
jgi:lipopolysaccharide transport system ATP-binding protein